MKKLLMLMLSALLIGTMSISAFAASPDDELGSIKGNIVETTNDLFGHELGQTISESDIDLSNAYKIYVDTNVFLLDSTDAEELEQSLETGGYIYEIPIYVGNDTIIVNVAKGQPLDNSVEFTEKERQEILANAGKWHVSAVKLYENEKVDYETTLTSAIGEVPENVMLVGGLPNFRFAVALLPDETGEITALVPLSEVPGIEAISRFLMDSNIGIYDYEQTKEYINSLPTPDPDIASGNYGFTTQESTTFNYSIAIGMAIVLLAGTSIIIAKRKLKTVK